MTRHLLTILVLAATAAGHFTILQAQDEAGKAAPAAVSLDIPAVIGPYVQMGTDEDPGDNVREILQTSTILMRKYTSSEGRPISVSIVHAAATRRSLHFPEVCLVGQGWEVREQSTAPVGASHTAKRLVIVRGDQSDAVLYWFKAGKKLTGNYYVNAWYWAKDTLLLRSPTSTMIRLSTPVGRSGGERAFKALEDFAVLLDPIVLDNIR
jgi:EpsI family protein